MRDCRRQPRERGGVDMTRRDHVILCVIGNLSSLHQMTTVQFDRNKLITPGADEKWFFSGKRIDDLPDVLVRLKARPVHRGIVESDSRGRVC